MPTRRKYGGRRRRRNGVPGLATRPRMMPRSLATKRKHAVDTRVFWFKQVGTITSLPPINNPMFREYRTTALFLDDPPSLQHAKALYDQYKILGMKLRLFPANVGAETTGESSSYIRGNHALWVDQRFDPLAIAPTAMEQILGTASARLINSRRPYNISIWRPKGKPLWGSCRDTGTPDPWVGVINYFIEDASETQPGGNYHTFYYYTMQWKVLFRSRVDD